MSSTGRQGSRKEEAGVFQYNSLATVGGDMESLQKENPTIPCKSFGLTMKCRV